MRKLFYALIAFSLMPVTSCQQKIDIVKEEEAIKAVIEGEIKASFNGDYETWESFFAHEPYTYWLQANNETYVSWKGWEEISSQMKQYVKPDRKGSITYEGNSDYTISVYQESALAVFKCKFSIEADEYLGLEVRALEKKDGEWKITYLGTVYSSTYEKEEVEAEAN
jgi:hypothetical protein